MLPVVEIDAQRLDLGTFRTFKSIIQVKASGLSSGELPNPTAPRQPMTFIELGMWGYLKDLGFP
jgi:hypothetical protein